MNTYLKQNSRHRFGVIHLDLSNMIEFEIIFVLIARLFIQWGLPNSIIYILDIVNIMLFFNIIGNRNWKRFHSFVIAYIGIIVLSVLSAIVNYTEWKGNPLFTLIELRNIVRFLIFFIACVSILNEENYKRIYKILTIFFFLNACVILYQYFTFHPVGIWTRGDYLNGLFGTTVGGNTFVNVTLLVVIVYLLSRWSEREASTKLFLFAILISLLIAGLIELKAYFIEFFILYLWYLVKKKKSKKEKRINIVVIFLLIVVSYVGLQIMFKEYPWFKETMSISGIIEALTGNGYTGTGDLNRFTGIFTIAKNMFKGEMMDILFGIGVGNCSAFELGGHTTRFFQLYQNSHYNWFSDTFTFVQSGLVGFMLYLYTFFDLFIKKKENKFKLNSQIMCIIAFFLVFYGEALKTDAGYLVFFAIASGFLPQSKGQLFTETEGYIDVSKID